MLATLAVLAASTLAADALETPAERQLFPQHFGPLPVRALDSLSLLFFQAPLETAAVVPAGAWELANVLHYASHESSGGGGGFSVQRDGELLRWELRARYGLAERVELSISLPVHYTTSGFLDEFIDDVHETTDLGPTGRADDEYTDVAAFNGAQFAGFPEDRLALADIPLAAKYAVWSDGADPCGVALRVGVELPAASTSGRLGSGTVDGSLGLLVEKSFFDFSVFASLDGLFQDTPEQFEDAGVSVDPAVLSSALALEWRLQEWIALLGQVNYAGPLVADGHGSILGRDRLLLTLGLEAQLSEEVRFLIAFSQDPVSGPVQDVSFSVGLTARW